jgi:hypothetical protein
MKSLFIGAYLMLLASVSWGDVIYTEPLDGELDQYCADLLLKILNYNGGTYTLKQKQEATSQNRDIASLEKNEIDVIWIATSIEYEKRIKPIRIPMFKGLLGYRIFVIQQSNQALFDDIKTLSDLKKISIGQGLGWVDADILRSNGFRVIGALNHDQLYTMLARNRFDSLLRGIQEPWAEIENFKDSSIVVEKNILIEYPLPMYFFVNKNNVELEKLININFNKMIDDGSFDVLFNENPKFKYAIEKVNLPARKIYKISNTFLPPETPLNEKKYWLDIKSMTGNEAQKADESD